MIISKTPLRMSFVGGGTDLPSFYRRTSGAVVSTAINKYIYVTVNKKFDQRIRISYSRTEDVDSIFKVEHPIVREVLKTMDIGGGLEITSIADVPSKGTGLGSSSAFTVGLLNALHAFTGKFCSSENLSSLACKIELDLLSEPIGKQDQYAAGYGGLNLIEFHPDETVSVKKLICNGNTLKSIEDHCIVFYTGVTRSASDLLYHQNYATESDIHTFEILKNMADIAHEMAHCIQSNQVEDIGYLLHKNWVLKKALSDRISNPWLDELYERGLKAGASGGKILGAGSGGFLMFFAPPDRHESISNELLELRHFPLSFEKQGSSIIFVH